METKYFKVRNKRKRCRTFLKEEIKTKTSDNWLPTIANPDFLSEIGITAPPNTILVAHSGSTRPTVDGKVAGIDVLRIDINDAPDGKYNWDHYDVCLIDENEAVLVLSENQRRDHWFPEILKWFERLIQQPPHLDDLDYDIEEIKDE